MILGYLNKNIENAKKILKIAVPEIGKLKNFSAQGALKNAIVTNKHNISENAKAGLRPIIGKYIG